MQGRHTFLFFDVVQMQHIILPALCHKREYAGVADGEFALKKVKGLELVRCFSLDHHLGLMVRTIKRSPVDTRVAALVCDKEHVRLPVVSVHSGFRIESFLDDRFRHTARLIGSPEERITFFLQRIRPFLVELFIRLPDRHLHDVFERIRPPEILHKIEHLVFAELFTDIL